MDDRCQHSTPMCRPCVLHKIAVLEAGLQKIIDYDSGWQGPGGNCASGVEEPNEGPEMRDIAREALGKPRRRQRWRG